MENTLTHVGERSRSICTQDWPRQPLFTSLLASASAAFTSAGMDMAARVSSIVFVSVGTTRLCVCVCRVKLRARVGRRWYAALTKTQVLCQVDCEVSQMKGVHLVYCQKRSSLHRS